MTPGHVHPGPAGGPGLLFAAAALLAVVAYLSAAARLRHRGDAWPWRRDASFAIGGVVLALAFPVPLPGGPFTAHTLHHLLTGMAAPLLLVLARPLTLVLRALPPGSARRGLLAVAHSRPAALLALPSVAALLDFGGLWLVHRTPLFAATQHHPLLQAVVQVHVVAAGLLFAFAVCRLDPVRRGGGGLAGRGAVLLAGGTAHAVLAKGLYADGPPGTAFSPADLHAGARLMYYGGDLVELALALVLAVQWYASAGRTWARRSRPRPARDPVAGDGSGGDPGDGGGAECRTASVPPRRLTRCVPDRRRSGPP
ncbi:cytochrome c oxidase assembly protein [Streptomyces sp. NPDC056529]|uniref:cytochrome c oxidase assembly protein n=1 Tax=Streptomyces sp. NPDC056529 TaxID=3345855 RepID=UPI0036A1BC13